MGCNCKGNKPAPPPPPVIQVNNVVEYAEEQAPNYSREDLIRIKDYLNSNIKKDEERNFVYQFMFNHYGENMMGYCDQNCLARIDRRVKEMEIKLTYYESKGKTS
jgi:hypothetical protein